MDNAITKMCEVFRPRVDDGTRKLVVHLSDFYPETIMFKDKIMFRGNAAQFKELYIAVGSALMELGVIEDLPDLVDEIDPDTEEEEE